MLVIREVYHCRPGKVRELVRKFQEMARLMPASQTQGMRILTDFAGERYWTAVFEMQVASMAEFEKMMTGEGKSEEDGKKMEKIMDGYHDLVDRGYREIFKLE